MKFISLAEGIRLAEIDDVAWVFHVDTDELMYPAGAGEFSLQVSNYAIKVYYQVPISCCGSNFPYST